MHITAFLSDHSFGILSLLPNLLRDFGWNPGKKIHNWFGEKIAAKSPTNDPDMTFYEVCCMLNLLRRNNNIPKHDSTFNNSISL